MDQLSGCTWLVLIPLLGAAHRRASHHGGAERDSQVARPSERSRSSVSLKTHHLGGKNGNSDAAISGEKKVEGSV